MNQLMTRGFDDELSAAISRLARREGISLNEAALRLLRKGAGLTDGAGGTNTIGSSLDHLIGSWTKEEADAMDSALQEFGTTGTEAGGRLSAALPAASARRVDTLPSARLVCLRPF